VMIKDAEGCRLGGIGQYLSQEICSRIGTETRVTVLGHIQRGGMPSHLDRLIATCFGVAAVDLIAKEKYDHVVTWQQRSIVAVPIEEAISKYSAVNPHGTLATTARQLGIFLGS